MAGVDSCKIATSLYLGDLWWGGGSGGGGGLPAPPVAPPTPPQAHSTTTIYLGSIPTKYQQYCGSGKSISFFLKRPDNLPTLKHFGRRLTTKELRSYFFFNEK